MRFTQEDARLLVSLQKQRRYDSKLRRDHAQQPPEALVFRGCLLGSFQSFDLLSLDDLARKNLWSATSTKIH